MNTIKQLCALSLLITCSLLQAFQWGFAERQGRRPSMEDAHVIKQDNKSALFALFDGHGGKEVSGYAALQLAEAFCANSFIADLSGVSDWVKRLELEIETLGYESGSTMITVHIDKATRTGNLFWVGDSRAIVIRNGKVIASTDDHKPNAPSEAARIKQAGNSVFRGYVVNSYGAGLAVARTIGDLPFRKKIASVISDPEMKSAQLQAGDYIIIACDGLWDVLSNEDVAAHITKAQPTIIDDNKLHVKGKPDHASSEGALKAIAQSLRDTAFDKGSTDNISVIVVKI